MKRKFLAVLAFALLLSLVLTVVVAAGDGCGEPPPPCEPPPCECSPGFWKNHTDIWEEWAGGNFEDWLGMLQARGPGSHLEREYVADLLNAQFPGACD